jgi:gamma-glutamyl hydrolase
LEKEMQPDLRFAGYNSYIMKSYVDWLEAAGARIVPLVLGEDEEVTLNKLKGMNGVLFPGGDGDYHEFGQFIFNAMRDINDQGTYLPIWGTCAGFHELVAYVADDGWDVLDIFDMDSASLTLDFAYEDPTDLPMYAGLGPSARLLEEYNVTYNSHHWSLDPKKFKIDRGLNTWFKPTSLSYMPD